MPPPREHKTWHPVIDLLLSLLTKGKDGTYDITTGALERLATALLHIATAPHFPAAVRDIAYICYILHDEKHSKRAALSVLRTADAVAQHVMKLRRGAPAGRSGKQVAAAPRR